MAYEAVTDSLRHVEESGRLDTLKAVLMKKAEANREPDFYLRNYRLEDKELTALKKFQRHRCTKRDWTGRPAPSLTVAFTGCGMGTAVEVSCHCGKRSNITDYSGW